MRLFVAVWPDAATQHRLSALDLDEVQGLRLVRPENWHITLRFIGEVEDSIVPAIIDSLRNAAVTVRGPVHCQIGPATAWLGGTRVLQMPVAGLDEMAIAVRAQTDALVPKDKPDGGHFVGHLTLARSRRRLSATRRRELAGIPFSSAFDVDYFDLVRSDISRHGPRYDTLERLLIAR